MGDSGGGLVAGIGAIALAFFIFYWIVYIAVAIAIGMTLLAMMALGLISFVMAKSSKFGGALVSQQHAGRAFLAAVQWSGSLCVGCMIGSLGLLMALRILSPGDYGGQLMSRHAVGLEPVQQMASFTSGWIGNDAFGFFVNVSLVLYLANRIAIAQKLGGTHWLSVVPPLGAAIIFFVSKHWNAIRPALLAQDSEALLKFSFALISELVAPFYYAFLAFTEPEKMWQWVQNVFWASEGSFFQLGALMPSIMGVMAALVIGQSLFYGNSTPSPA